jgi:hypothetical protein
VDNQQRFIRALLRGERLCRVKDVYGRIVRTMQPAPERLAEEAERRVVPVMGPGGLQRLLGKTGYQSLITIGYTPEYIANLVARGMKYKLILFDRPDEMRIATWTASVEFASQHYPELRTVLYRALTQLRASSLEEFERQKGFRFYDVERAGRNDPRFMTPERLLASEQTPADVRCFLFHTLHFTDLYAGDGYTKTISGERGVREYLMHNARLETLRNCRVIELPVSLPE